MSASAYEYRPHLRGMLHFFILFTCGGVLAAGIFVLAIDPDPASGIRSLLIAAGVAVVSGLLTFHAANLWIAQRFVVAADGVEHRLGKHTSFIPLSEIVAITFSQTPFLSGRACIESADRKIVVPTTVGRVERLIDDVRTAVRESGRDDPVDPVDLEAWRETAAFCEQRAARFDGVYRWFPLLAVASPIAVASLNVLVSVSFPHLALWAAVFAVYPWLIAAIYELMLASRFKQLTIAGAPPVFPARDRGYEQQLARRTVLVAYFAFLVLNLAVFVRVA